jgi:hypothetical protein
MTFDLGAGRHLVLAGGGRAAIWIAVGAVALLLLLALYRYELRLVSRRVGLALLGTRLVAAMVLVGALLEPIAEVRYDEHIRGRVILGVDLSQSMATADPIARVEGSSVSLSLSDPLPTVSRREVARRLLEGEWIKSIAAEHNVEASGFARDTIDGTITTLADALGARGGWGDPSRLVTDWNPVLARALQGEGSAPILGVVLLTDGRQNAPADTGRTADRLAARGIPVFPVLIGSTIPPKDVAIASIKAPESVFQGDVASVEVVVKVDGIPGVEVPVTLERPGSSPSKQLVRGQPDGSRPVVTFRVPMNTLGSHELAIAVGPLVGDVQPENDRRAIAIQVADDKAKVLLVDGEARWEFRYLRNALLRDPRVAVETVVFRQPKSDGGTPVYKNALPAKPKLKAEEADPLGAFDAIFVGDVEPSIMPAEAWSRLEAYVSGRGGTLVISPGPRGWPQSVLSIEPVVKLLPVLDPRPVPFDAEVVDPSHPSLPAGVAIAPLSTISAESWPMLQLAAADRNGEVWSSLPRLSWVLAGRAKPGATVLATRTGADSASDGVVIAAQPYGLGKVLWVGTDATWRWRYRVGDAYHHRFWGQVVRWAAVSKLAAGNALVRFGPDRPKVAEGESVRLQARFADGVPGVGPELLAVARVFAAATPQAGGAPKPEGDVLAVIPLQSVPGLPRTFAATAPNLPAGRYMIHLDVPQLATSIKGDSAGSAPKANMEIVERTTSELAELSACRDPLERLAAATGGRVFTPEEAGQIPPLLRGRATVKSRTEETTLWDRPWSLGVFFAVLTFEWVLRKRAGLP